MLSNRVPVVVSTTKLNTAMVWAMVPHRQYRLSHFVVHCIGQPFEFCFWLGTVYPIFRGLALLIVAPCQPLFDPF